MNTEAGLPLLGTGVASADPAEPRGSPRATAESPEFGKQGEPSRPFSSIPAGEPQAARLRAVEAAANPLLEAARPLLRALADMPDELDVNSTAHLHLLLKQEIRVFQRLCEQANIRREHMIGARYCLCTALDDAATQTAWGNCDNGVKWMSNGLATEFHEDRQGGDKVYLLIGRLMSEPHDHLDLLEVIYRILSLGFMGRYRHETDGARKHDAVRQRIYNELQTRRGVVPIALAPHVQSDARGRRLSVYDFPVWITLVVLGVILTGLFAWFKYHLLERSAAVEKQIIEIARMTPPPVPKLPRLMELLRDEIAAGTVSVDEDAHHSAVTFRGDAMFLPGAVNVNASMGPLIAKIAREISKVPGRVVIAGYTDSVPVRSRQFASNDALSEERATQVMQMLQADGVPAARLEAIGKGASNPIGDNRTAQGRAQNRRVAITVTP
ncbi:type VI secretion system protein TssL, long form [Paraburkholderia rhizosphaerae]|uniref:Type VI secretion system protein ImpK n=1 Tax=Paraburkholderia rhizosphaerae TaxID=480658 RepID=A0A4R8LDU0_9BURK|nr:type VI secretion system protein TssL, long form [Paraburkholderia rhizosphaerae]TDY40270.1 type VI secretion system protein ImpK [Paraburkholderia rhizosphaerae]